MLSGLQSSTPERNKLSENVFVPIEYDVGFKFSDVKLQLPFTGTDGETFTTDESLIGQTVTFGTGFAISNVDFNSSPTSGLGTTAVAGFNIQDETNFDPNLDFTFEFFFKRTATSGQILVEYRSGLTANDYSWRVIDASGTIIIRLYPTQGSPLPDSTGFVESTAWDHYCFINSGGNFYFFKNGVPDGVGPLHTGTLFVPSGAFLQIKGGAAGGGGPSGGKRGYIDDVRYSNFVIYDINGFTPPPVPFPTS